MTKTQKEKFLFSFQFNQSIDFFALNIFLLVIPLESGIRPRRSGSALFVGVAHDAHYFSRLAVEGYDDLVGDAGRGARGW